MGLGEITALWITIAVTFGVTCIIQLDLIDNEVYTY